MTFFSKAALNQLAANPDSMAAFYTTSRAAFKKALGSAFSGQPEDHIKLAFCALVAYELKPYGSSVASTLPALLAEPGLDCDNYALLSWYLYKKMASSGADIALVGWDGGAVGNHAQLLISTPGKQAMLVDPTVGLFSIVGSYNALVAGEPVATTDRVSFYSRDDIDWFNGKVVKAVTDGLYEPGDFLYYYTSPDELLSYLPLARTKILGVDDKILTLTGSSNLDGIGNGLNNVLNGNAGANTLRGLFGDDRLFGKSGNDVLYGDHGNDYLDGGFGYDKMIGGRGNDTYVVNSLLDVVREEAGQGIDTVRASVSYTLDVNVENLVLTGSGHLTGTGNAASNTITGNAGNNVLNGMNGFDFLYGGAGSDTLIGGAGNDFLDGGNGYDLMIGGTGNDTYVVNGWADIVQEEVGEGIDTIQSWISLSLTSFANVENLTLLGKANLTATGNADSNVIVGNEGRNVIDGGLGNDIIIGGGGKDLLRDSEGNDRFVFKAITDSGVRFADRDVITSFDHGDIIDLSAIDANTKIGGNQAFKLVTAFSGTAGELTATLTNAASRGFLIYADVDGDKNPDFSLQVYGAPTFDKLHAWDFIL
ncbi:calcium-binding protein [Microvirga antarctica]|uniref:calcium-binding protein n=1 Tax=Microvirga antarctica TaxID=2819233 RepID=UPI001B31494D|nr:calcium-binding protein [Microvirga antarctica]